MRLLASLVRAGAGPALLSLLGGAVVVSVLAGVAALQSEVLPPPGVWVGLVALAPLGSSTILVPLALTAAVVAPLRAWRSQGAWLGAQSMGVTGRALLPWALGLGLVAGGLTAVSTLVVEPSARRAARELVAAAGEGCELLPGRSVRVGALGLYPLQGASLVVLELPGALGVAEQVRLVRTEGELSLETTQVQLASPGAVIRAERWVHALPRPRAPRVELAERTTADLAQAVSRTEASGADASYERAVLLKRFAHPLSVGLLALALVPLGLRRRPWLMAGMLGVGWLGAVRAGDHLASALGAWPAASTGLVLVLCWTLVGWLSWRQR